MLIVLGLKKSLKEAANSDKSGLVQQWSQSIVNHMYWVAADTSKELQNRQEVVEAKWLSLTNHIVGKHSHHYQHYPKCSHGRRKKGEKRKKYMKKGIIMLLLQCQFAFTCYRLVHIV